MNGRAANGDGDPEEEDGNNDKLMIMTTVSKVSKNMMKIMMMRKSKVGVKS